MRKIRSLLNQQIHTEVGCADTKQIGPGTRGFFDIEATTPLTSTHMYSERGMCMWCVVCMTGCVSIQSREQRGNNVSFQLSFGT